MAKGWKKRKHRGMVYKVSCNEYFLYGSTVNFSNRRYQYLKQLRLNKYSNPILQNCYNKYGEESIKFEIVQENIPEDILLFVEDIWMGANCSLRKDNPYGMNLKPASKPEFSQETKDKISKQHKGKKLSEETKAKMRGRVPWNKGQTGLLSEESRKNISKSLHKYFGTEPKEKKPKRDLRVYCGLDGKIYNNIKEFARLHNIGHTTIYRQITKQRNNKYNLHFYNKQKQNNN